MYVCFVCVSVCVCVCVYVFCMCVCLCLCMYVYISFHDIFCLRRYLFHFCVEVVFKDDNIISLVDIQLRVSSMRKDPDLSCSVPVDERPQNRNSSINPTNVRILGCIHCWYMVLSFEALVLAISHCERRFRHHKRELPHMSL